MQDVLKFLLKGCIVFCLTGSLLVGALVGARAIPREAILEQVRESAMILLPRGDYPDFSSIRAFKVRMDNFTDSLMLNIMATSENPSPLQSAMASSVMWSNDSKTPQTETLYQSVIKPNDNEPLNIVSYGRYWHGYQTILRPLLLFMNFAELQTLGQILMSSLVALLLVGLCLRKWYIEALALLLFWIPRPMCGLAVASSFQFSSVFYIALLTANIIVWWKKPISITNFALLMMVVGQLTSFFDLLTAPIVTFALPAFLWIRAREGETFGANLWALTVAGFAWGIGFVVFWIIKWFLCALTPTGAKLEETLHQLVFRTAFTENVERWHSKTPEILLISALFPCLFLLALLFRRYIFGPRATLFLQQKAPQVLLMLLPVAWYFVAWQHVNEHWWFARRNFYVANVIFLSTILAIFYELIRSRFASSAKRNP